MFEPNEQRRADLEKLKKLVLELQDGERISFVEVEQKTGVTMNSRGRSLLRLAFDRVRRPYLALAGKGVEASSAANGLEIVDKSARRLASSYDSARETTERVAGRHLNEFTQDQKNRLIHHQALLGTLALSASLAKKPGALPDKAK